jgi:hypothetical protein
MKQVRHTSCCAKVVLGYAREILFATLLCAIVALTGCATAPESAGDNGAIINKNRAQAALDRLRPSYSGPAKVYLMASDSPAAYSWPNGTICLTRGLVCLLNDDEICAVIAHELGHLAHAQGGCQGFALGGPRTADEQRADAVGIMLLRTSGVAPSSLGHALSKVRDASGASDDLRRAMTVRIAALPN